MKQYSYMLCDTQKPPPDLTSYKHSTPTPYLKIKNVTFFGTA